jgi:hypothetical protein
MGLNSVSLLPDTLKAEVLSSDERRAIAERILRKVRSNGSLPTVSVEDVGEEVASKMAYAAGGGPAGPIGELCVGYDPGLLLITLTRLQHPAARQVFHWLIGLLDQAGAWNEYYDGQNQTVRNCIRANAWASGVNAEAVVEYLAVLGNQVIP